MVDSGVRVRPAASPGTWKRLTPAAVRAATRIRSATWPSSTYIFVPVIFQVPPSSVAVASMPDSSHLPLASVKASVAMVSPEAMPGRSAALAASSPECITALAASTTVEK